MLKLKNYWYLIALSVVVSILANHFFIFFYFLFSWLLYLFYFKKINTGVFVMCICAFFFFYNYIPSLDPPVEPETNMPQSFTGKITGPVTKTEKKIEFLFRDNKSPRPHLALLFIDNSQDIQTNNNIGNLQYGAHCTVTGRSEE